MNANQSTQHCCPNCGGPQIARKKMLYYQGTTNTDGSYSGSYGGSSMSYGSFSTGVSMLSTGLHAGKQSGSYSSVSQTMVAEYVAPPRRIRVNLLRLIVKYFIRILILSLLGEFLEITIFEKNELMKRITALIVSLGSLAAIIYAIYKFVKAIHYNNLVYPKLYAQWEREWFCQSCGKGWTY